MNEAKRRMITENGIDQEIEAMRPKWMELCERSRVKAFKAFIAEFVEGGKNKYDDRRE